MDGSRNPHHQHLGVSKISKSIRKSPLHHPNFSNPKPVPGPGPPQPQAPPQPQVYNISKNDFRSIVQQLTGTPSRDAANPNPPSLPPPSRPPHPKPPSMRLQRIRPPPLTPIARPLPPIAAPLHHNPNANHSSFHPQPVPSPAAPQPNWAESPISAYMRYLESSLLTSDASRHSQYTAGLLPSPSMHHPGPAYPPHRGNPPPPAPGAYPSPRGNPPPALLPSPGPQFMMPSPSGFLNLLSPRSPYPLLSPGFQHPPPLTPNFFSPLTPQSGILGPGPPPPSPGLLFPPSPSGFLPMMSPRWRDM